MLRIFDESCRRIVPAEGGFAAVFEGRDGRARFKYVSVKDDTARDIDNLEFCALKFGPRYEQMRPQIESYLGTTPVRLDKNTVLVVSEDGAAKVLDRRGAVLRRGDLRFNGEPPRDVCAEGGEVWASYLLASAIVRYNLSTLKMEIRIGGGGGAICDPEGLLLQDRQLFLCNSGTGSVITIDTSRFTMREYLSFDEPVFQFLKVEGFAIARLRSGVYRI